jgi:hypothetical protein
MRHPIDRLLSALLPPTGKRRKGHALAQPAVTFPSSPHPAPRHHHTEEPSDPAYLAHPVDRGAWVRPYVMAHAQRRATVLTAVHTRSVGVAR